MMGPKSISTEEAKKYLDSHEVTDYSLVDVRQDWEYEEFHLPGAKLIPLPELMDRLGEIPHDKPTLVYCAAGGRSASAASLLSGQGMKDVYNILGGAMAWKDEYAVGPQEQGMVYFKGDETLMQIVVLAYAMEANLGAFYTKMAATAKKPEIADSFNQLAKFEEAHKAKVFKIAQSLDVSLRGQAEFERQVAIEVLEGGTTADAFVEKNRDYLQTSRGAVEAAMMIEAQALDLYMRYAEKAKKDEAAMLLQELAQEEKAHLKVLGRLMDRKIVGKLGD